MSEVMIRRLADGLTGILPPGAPTVLDAAADVDVMVLEVAGGHLSWNVLAPQQLPSAVIDDAELAQQWVWALYGEALALALDASARTPERETPVYGAEPGQPALAASARRLAYAHWASRWWPASTIDAIPPLDPEVLDRDIAALTEECEFLVDGADAVAPAVRAPVDALPRAADYALAAGAEGDGPGALVLARGRGGWDWRYCPPGLVDASERAVSWRVVREDGATTVAVSAAAAPEAPADVAAYLRPWARIDSGGTLVEAALTPSGGAWVGAAAVSSAGAPVHVDIHVPGFGIRTGDASVDLRSRIRDFAAARLRRAVGVSADGQGSDAPLLAEIAAAAEDSDF
ncbi:hypothetical protein ABZ319_09870 [Nocardia sp. NPDC005978]|uniref:hypothetical protein n=1 Tax=Nocardia sp. NPDC005978 TaxID=3156725 RepID=UPI0033BDB2A2